MDREHAIEQLSAHQRQILRMLEARRDRELYEGAAAGDRNAGSGEFWVTYSADERYAPLPRSQVLDMKALGLIVEKWPGSYVLAPRSDAMEK